MRTILRRRARAAFASAGLCLCLFGAGIQPVQAAPVAWRSSMVHLSVESKELKEVLRDFTASQGIATTIDERIAGSVSGRFDMSPQRFLDTLASTFGFVWFYDGSVLSITSANDVTRQVIHLDYAPTSALRKALRDMGLDNRRFPVVYDSSQGTALVSGPPQYVALVGDVARRLDENANRRVGTEVRVFSLKHGWAADHNVQIDGKTVTVPGVARVLANMYHPPNDADAAGTTRNNSNGGGDMAPSMQRVSPMSDASGNVGGGSPFAGGANAPLPNLLGSMTGQMPTRNSAMGGGNAGSGTIPPITGYTPIARDGSGTGAVPSGAGGLPVIQADPRTNSVLIRDLPERMGQYGELIKQLDMRRRLIEIEAHIIEIDEGALKQLGVDWRAHNSHIDIQTGTGSTTANSYNGQLNPTFSTTNSSGTTVINTTPAGLSMTAVLGDAGRYLLARVNALESTDQARIDASPKVATLDNVEAVMDNKKRFYVRVQGYTSGDLYSISTGTSLRVLPMVVDEDGRQQIKLQVHVEDGQTTGDTVDSIPVITSSSINTEAVVTQGESLLIAGYRVDNSSNTQSGVPVLSKIPVLGALFRYRENSRSHMERLFLLSPRVIEF